MYRVYNPNAGDHHYTLNEAERDYLITVGWRDEGIGWYSPDDGDACEVFLYRLYNPNAVAGAHHYAMSAGERDMLAAAGWVYEGTCWASLHNIVLNNAKAANCTETGYSGDAICSVCSKTYGGEVIATNDEHTNTYHEAVYEEEYIESGLLQSCKVCGTEFGTIDDGPELSKRKLSHFRTVHGLDATYEEVSFRCPDTWNEEKFKAWIAMSDELIGYTDVDDYTIYIEVSPAYYSCDRCGKVSYDGNSWQ